jgi:DNA-binding response OmpR family regulator
MAIANRVTMASTGEGAFQRILVVDDDDATRHGLAELLIDAGYSVEPVGTLKAAMDVLSRCAPDLLITDIRLQGYNGLQLLAMSPRRVPAIVITGFPDRMLESDAQKMGAEYLIKPVSPARLLAVIRQKLSQDVSDTEFSPSRRWVRKPVSSQLKAWVQDLPVRILDISYGGLQLAFDRPPASTLPRALSLTLPTSNVAIDVNVVWQRPNDGSGWLCGAAISEPSPRLWRQIVDGVPAH